MAMYLRNYETLYEFCFTFILSGPISLKVHSNPTVKISLCQTRFFVCTESIYVFYIDEN